MMVPSFHKSRVLAPPGCQGAFHATYRNQLLAHLCNEVHTFGVSNLSSHFHRDFPCSSLFSSSRAAQRTEVGADVRFSSRCSAARARNVAARAAALRKVRTRASAAAAQGEIGTRCYPQCDAERRLRRKWDGEIST